MYKKTEYGYSFFKNLGNGSCMCVTIRKNGEAIGTGMEIMPASALNDTVYVRDESSEPEFNEAYEKAKHILMGAML